MSEHSPNYGETGGGRLLSVDYRFLGRIEHCLGVEGPGALHIPGVLDNYATNALLTEAANPELVVWTDAGDDYINERGVQVVQNHEVFALKLSRGDQEPIVRVPIMRQLALETEGFIRSLGDVYPSLESWEADEMSYHRYYDQEVGLSPHRDNKRFTGLVIVITLEGECDFQIVRRFPAAYVEDPDTGKKVITDWDWRSTYTIPVSPGSMVLMRAPGLLLDADDSGHLRPEHAVVNMTTESRTAFLLRANSRSNDTKYGFNYYNWP